MITTTMKSKASQTTNLLICLLLCHLTFTAKAQDPPWVVCNPVPSIPRPFYTPGSTFQSNLNLNIPSLVSNISSNGFSSRTTGNNPDAVYSQVQCRGDVSNQDCSRCANASSSEIVRRCPTQREAVIFSDTCMLHYADYEFSTPSVLPAYTTSYPQNVSNPDLFNRQLLVLMNNLSSQAAANASKFATGSTNYTAFNNIYGLAQCINDWAESQCSQCLNAMIRNISSCCSNKQAARILSTSCYIQYDINPFYKDSTPSTSAAPPGIGSTNSTSNSGVGGTVSLSPVMKESDKDNFVFKVSIHGRKIQPFTSLSIGKWNILRYVGIIVSSAAIATVLTSTVFIYYQRRKYFGRKDDADVEEDDEIGSNESLIFDLATLRLATNNFNDAYKLGQGGFGPVYKGKLPNGRKIAVKRLARKSGQGLEELKNEVVLVAKLLHRNLVRLVGFCIEEEEKLLVYEFLPNGSLDKILFNESKRGLLDWDKRYNIITGIARGMLYLHQDSQIRIIHRDLKASNILLDKDMNPKISDFGLARLFSESYAEVQTNRLAGTYGYMAPEYTRLGQFSIKSDVFSFGVLVLEIVTGQKNSSFQDSMNLLTYAWQLWNDGKALELVDPVLGDQSQQSEILKCIQLGLLCVQQDASDRPTMSEVLLLLNTYSVECPTPSRPAYFMKSAISKSNTTSDSSAIHETRESSVASSRHSVNLVTISNLDPR